MISSAMKPRNRPRIPRCRIEESVSFCFFLQMFFALFFARQSFLRIAFHIQPIQFAKRDILDIVH